MIIAALLLQSLLFGVQSHAHSFERLIPDKAGPVTSNLCSGTQCLSKEISTLAVDISSQLSAASITTVDKTQNIDRRQALGCVAAGSPADFTTSICSCLHIPTPTSTTTQYVTIPPSQVYTVTITSAPTSTSTITQQSVSATFTTIVPQTDLFGNVHLVALVNVPPSTSYATITQTSGTAAFTSTVPTIVGGLLTTVVVANVASPSPTPFHLFLTDYGNHSVYGYLRVNNPVFSGTSHQAVGFSDFTSSSLFYLDPITGSLALSPLSGVVPQPLYSSQQTGGSGGPLLFDTVNPSQAAVQVTYWPDQTLHITNSQNGQIIASLCSGVLYLTSSTPAGCQQIALTPVYYPVNFTSTTVTSGFVGATVTVAPQGTPVSLGGTVIATVPAGPYCTGTFGYNNNGQSPGNNSGLLYAAWSQPWKRQASVNIQMSYFSIADPFFWGQTNRIGGGPFSGYNNYALYTDSPSVGLQFINVMHIGYLYARTTGTYTFTAANADDIVYLWTGSNAISGYTNSNANFMIYYTQVPASYTITLQAGTYTPFRVFWGNEDGPGNFQFTITDPAGVPLLDGTTSRDIVVSPCPGAPAVGTSAFPSLVPQCGSGLSYQGLPNAVPCTTQTCIDDTGYANFKADYFNDNATLLPPLFYGPNTGSYEPMFFTPDGNIALYGMPSRSVSRTAIIYRGYFVPPESGTYKFYLPTPSWTDDVQYVWVNSNSTAAWVGWHESNYNIRATYYPRTGQTVYSDTYTFQAQAGVYIPVTILWADAYGGGFMQLQTTFPNGSSTLQLAPPSDPYFQSILLTHLPKLQTSTFWCGGGENGDYRLIAAALSHPTITRLEIKNLVSHSRDPRQPPDGERSSPNDTTLASALYAKPGSHTVLLLRDCILDALLSNCPRLHTLHATPLCDPRARSILEAPELGRQLAIEYRHELAWDDAYGDPDLSAPWGVHGRVGTTLRGLPAADARRAAGAAAGLDQVGMGARGARGRAARVQPPRPVAGLRRARRAAPLRRRGARAQCLELELPYNFGEFATPEEQQRDGEMSRPLWTKRDAGRLKNACTAVGIRCVFDLGHSDPFS
ncbi:hypothetical protein B0J12DRAFT_772945 [Macrophomina phaseolina]|uniref:PA14 domain-containing protein n=1 Tax=Macrophomina phaseolina TaxID=35725 RepID=A0ABQ8GKV6_9PEZI|nr:hypothetical protein B0J12DRAFT_772945 [Macrophomina phaseolina]